MAGLEHVRAYGGPPPRRYRQYLAWLLKNTELSDLLNVKYLLQDYRVVKERPRVLPRAFLVRRFVVERDPDVIEARLTTRGAIDFRTCVLLEEQPGRSGSLVRVDWEDAAVKRAHPRGTARVTEYAANAFEIEVRSHRDAFLVVSEVFYPGWRATLDGDPVPILRANYTLRAVYVPAGEHIVSMRYRPGSVFVGAAITGLAALLCALGLSVRRGEGRPVSQRRQGRRSNARRSRSRRRR
jgi:hypothetical protein